MTDPASSGEPTAGPLRLAEGLRLLGEYHGSGFAEPRFLVRRADGQVIQLSRLLYLVTEAIAGGDADGGSDAGRVAMCVAAAVGREVTAGNVRYLVAGQLVPLGVVIAGEPGRSLEIGHAAGPAGTQGPVPRMKLLLALKVRGVLLRPGAAGVAGRPLAWLHHPGTGRRRTGRLRGVRDVAVRRARGHRPAAGRPA
jgi:putative peptide zinc metalloprotease protein